MKHVGLIALFSLCSCMVAVAGETPSPPGAKVYFVNLADGATVSSPVKVIFGLSGMGVSPAGTEKENTGHHHMLIDRAALGKAPLATRSSTPTYRRMHITCILAKGRRKCF
jgi:hypothetical protein